MIIDEFRKNKIKGREVLLNKIIETFKKLNPVAIHQFGSGVSGYRDEFSDLDIWVTFQDEIADEIIKKRDSIYSNISQVLIKSESPQNSPLGGKYSLVIFDTDFGLYHVDFYLSKKSKTNIRPEAIFLHGTDELPRGEWIMDKDAETITDLEERMNQIITMAFILIKAIVRGGWNEIHADYLRSLYQDMQKIRGKSLKPLPETSDFVFLRVLLDNLITSSTKQQKKALSKIRDYAKQVEERIVAN